MKKTPTLLIALFLIITAMKSDIKAWQFYDKDGKKTDYEALVKAAGKADIVLFGEQHNSSICHWLQLQLVRDLFAEKGQSLVLGAEMFETDNQLILDEYLAGQMKASNFEGDARLWKNYKTDYKPLVDFAAEHQLRFIATNIPRRYASMVNNGGFEALDTLTANAKELFAPLPMRYDSTLPGYKSMLDMGPDMKSHSSANLPLAQDAKDATMAYFILQNWEPGQTFLHFNGSYHSDNFEGIVWHLLQDKPELQILTISSLEQDTISELKAENLGLGSFILCLPADMTKTY
jgi:uncharacterized iron-regulated protein